MVSSVEGAHTTHDSCDVHEARGAAAVEPQFGPHGARQLRWMHGPDWLHCTTDDFWMCGNFLAKKMLRAVVSTTQSGARFID
jgi:hypothetical protein